MHERKHVRADGDPQVALGDVMKPTLQFTFPADVPVDPTTG